MSDLSVGQRKQLRDLSKKYGFEHIVEQIETIAQSAVQMITTEPDDYSEVGVTRIGGIPDLPPSLEWPKRDDKFLVFVAQINLCELPTVENNVLPSNGILYFFHGYAESADDVYHRILYYSGDLALLRTAPQPDSSQFDEQEDFTHYPGYRVAMKTFISLPTSWFNDFAHEVKKNELIQGVNYPDLAFVKELYAFDKKYDSDLSQITGYPQQFTRPGQEYAAQKVREGKRVFDDQQPDPDEVKKWRLLSQVGSHLDVGMSWWDAGFLQFFIHEDELAQQDFSRTYANIETS